MRGSGCPRQLSIEVVDPPYEHVYRTAKWDRQIATFMPMAMSMSIRLSPVLDTCTSS